MRDVILAFGRRAVALSTLRAGRIIAERDLIGLRQSLLPVLPAVKVKFALAFLDEYAVALFGSVALLRLIALSRRGCLACRNNDWVGEEGRDEDRVEVKDIHTDLLADLLADS